MMKLDFEWQRTDDDRELEHMTGDIDRHSLNYEGLELAVYRRPVGDVEQPRWVVSCPQFDAWHVPVFPVGLAALEKESAERILPMVAPFAFARVLWAVEQRRYLAQFYIRKARRAEKVIKAALPDDSVRQLEEWREREAVGVLERFCRQTMPGVSVEEQMQESKRAPGRNRQRRRRARLRVVDDN